MITLLSLAMLHAAPTPPVVQDEASPRTTTAQELKERIYDMRMELLLGGDNVRAAEQEAIGFYGQKGEYVDQRLDQISADLSEKRATYEVVLDRALDQSNEEDRGRVLGEAATLRGAIGVLETEASELEQRRDRLRQLIAGVEGRERDRRRLLAQIESAPDPLTSLGGIPFAGIGLAPNVVEPVAATSPLENDALIEDLLARDPSAARSLLFELDPVAYFERFPLRPPSSLLPRAIPFPLPDPPGSR